jgi:rhodanese-related sulfurtransferase
MNELQRTQRISIAVLIIAVVLVIGLMIKEKPKFTYAISASEMLAKLPEVEQITPETAKTLIGDTSKVVFIDIRNPYDFEVKHIENAINIPLAFLLDDENAEKLEAYNKANKTVVLYGKSQRDAVSVWMLLYEIGYTNTKILLGGFDCYQMATANCNLETARHDFAKIATQGSIKEVQPEVEPAPKKEPKKTVPVQTKVKAEAEGGC